MRRRSSWPSSPRVRAGTSGELDAAVVGLQLPELDPARRDPWSARLFYAYADNLLAAGRESEAVQWFVHAADADDEGDTDAAARLAELTGEAVPDDADDVGVRRAGAGAPAVEAPTSGRGRGAGGRGSTEARPPTSEPRTRGRGRDRGRGASRPRRRGGGRRGRGAAAPDEVAARRAVSDAADGAGSPTAGSPTQPRAADADAAGDRRPQSAREDRSEAPPAATSIRVHVVQCR